MYRILLIVLLSATIFGIACSDRNEFPSGYELLDRQNKGNVEQVTLYTTPNGEKQFREDIKAGTRHNLFIGTYQDYNAWSVIRFTILPDTPTVYSAHLSLKNISSKGDGNGFSATVHKVNTEWQESDVVLSDIANTYDLTEIGTVQVSPADSDSIVIEIDASLINSWIDSSEVNNGVLIKHEGADFLLEYYSSDNTNSDVLPKLQMFYTSSGRVDTSVTNAASYDATLFEYLGPEPILELLPADPFLRIGSASGFRTLLRFDLSDIPENATIHRGLLQLHINTENSETPTSGMNFGIYPIGEDSLWNPQTIEIDSTKTIPLGLATSDNPIFGKLEITYSTVFSFIIQSWTLGDSPNHGMIVRSVEHGKDTSHLSFYASSTQDSTLVPKLIVTYSVPPSPRF